MILHLPAWKLSYIILILTLKETNFWLPQPQTSIYLHKSLLHCFTTSSFSSCVSHVDCIWKFLIFMHSFTSTKAFLPCFITSSASVVWVVLVASETSFWISHSPLRVPHFTLLLREREWERQRERVCVCVYVCRSEFGLIVVSSFLGLLLCKCIVINQFGRFIVYFIFDIYFYDYSCLLLARFWCTSSIIYKRFGSSQSTCSTSR